MKIVGANMGEIEAEYKPLSEWNYTEHPYLIELLKRLENIYFNAKKYVEQCEVTSMPTEGDYVLLKSGMINHRCYASTEMLKGIAEYGVLASEWFGQYESELEGRFCTFLDRIKPDDFNDKNDNFIRLNAGDNAILFFDQENEMMKYLLHLDYFEYESIKKSNPEKINQIYTTEEIELFENVIEPLSPAGKDFHDEDGKNKRYYFWSAIPSGIPSKLINGICLTKCNPDEELINTVSALFPNAIIFDGQRKILSKPEKEVKFTK